MTKTMTRAEAVRITRSLLNVHGLTNWNVKIGHSPRRAGQANFQPQTIILSGVLMDVRSYDGTLDTIRHEVAHAIAGRNAGHGPVWKKTFISMGGDGNVRWSGDTLVKERPSKYKGTCTACGRSDFYMYRKFAGDRSCPCITKGRFDPRSLIIWQESATGRPFYPDYGTQSRAKWEEIIKRSRQTA